MIFIINLLHVNIYTFNEIGFVAKRTKGCSNLFEGKVFKTIKKWRTKMTIPCPLIS